MLSKSLLFNLYSCVLLWLSNQIVYTWYCTSKRSLWPSPCTWVPVSLRRWSFFLDSQAYFTAYCQSHAYINYFWDTPGWKKIHITTRRKFLNTNKIKYVYVWMYQLLNVQYDRSEMNVWRCTRFYLVAVVEWSAWITQFQTLINTFLFNKLYGRNSVFNFVRDVLDLIIVPVLVRLFEYV